jgi:hypothetical protein
MFIYFCIAIKIQLSRVKVGITLTSLSPSLFCTCLKTGPGFPSAYVIVRSSFVLNDFRREMIIHIVDIGGIVDITV